MSKSKRSFGKGEIADAYKRFKGHEFETPVQRFELEDSPTPQEQKANLADLILKQRDEITTLRKQLEQASARSEVSFYQGACVTLSMFDPHSTEYHEAVLQHGGYEALWAIASDYDKEHLLSAATANFGRGYAQRLRNQANELEQPK